MRQATPPPVKREPSGETIKSDINQILFAWLPIIVKTWRPRGTKAIIWLQRYQVQKGVKCCTKLGFFSHEF